MNRTKLCPAIDIVYAIAISLFSGVPAVDFVNFLSDPLYPVRTGASIRPDT